MKLKLSNGIINKLTARTHTSLKMDYENEAAWKIDVVDRGARPANKQGHSVRVGAPLETCIKAFHRDAL